MTKRLIGGYGWRQEITRAVNANRAARQSLRRILDEQPSGQVLALLVARAANSLAENLDALQALEHIGQASQTQPSPPAPLPEGEGRKKRSG